MSVIMAGIVLYNPEPERLALNLGAIEAQVERILCVDNNSQNLPEIQPILDRYPHLTLIRNSANRGIAAALNQLMGQAEAEQIEWVLTLDQDSICPDNIIEEYEKRISVDRVAMLTMGIYDTNLQKKEQTTEEFVRRCITSGCYTKTSVWREVGGFDEDFFIDYVDFEYCAKLMEAGYRIFRVGSVCLRHAVGNSHTIRLFGYKICRVYNHNPQRNYYLTRNALYYAFLHQKEAETFQVRRGILKRNILTVVFEKDRLKKLKAILKGRRDSRKMIKNTAYR